MTEQPFAVLVSPDGTAERRPADAGENVQLRFAGWTQKPSSSNSSGSSSRGTRTRKRSK